VTAAAMAGQVAALDHKPLAFGANCGTGAADLLRTVRGFTASGTQTPIIAKGNAGIPKYVDGHIHYDGTPELMADYAALARDCGARASARHARSARQPPPQSRAEPRRDHRRAGALLLYRRWQRHT